MPRCPRCAELFVSGGVLVGLILMGCEETPTDLPPPDLGTGNVEFLIDPAVVRADTGVVIDGTGVITHPSHEKALWVQRREGYGLGSFGGDYLRSLGWDVWFMHAREPFEPSDTIFWAFVDHGTATLAGTEMAKDTTPPSIGGYTFGYESYVRYALTTYRGTEWPDGTTEVDELPIHDPMVRGDPLAFETSGSGEAPAVTTEFSLQPFTRLAAVENDDPLALDTMNVPTVRTSRDLTLVFEGPLDPARTVVLLDPVMGGGSSAFVRALETTDRWIIPADSLVELVEDVEETPVTYRLTVLEYWVQDGVFEGTRSNGEAFSLSLVQRSQTTLPFEIQHVD